MDEEVLLSDQFTARTRSLALVDEFHNTLLAANGVSELTVLQQDCLQVRVTVDEGLGSERVTVPLVLGGCGKFVDQQFRLVNARETDGLETGVACRLEWSLNRGGVDRDCEDSVCFMLTARLTASAILAGSPAGSIMIVFQPMAWAASANWSTANLQPCAAAEHGIVTIVLSLTAGGPLVGTVRGISPDAAFATCSACVRKALADSLSPGPELVPPPSEPHPTVPNTMAMAPTRAALLNTSFPPVGR